jgi:cytochrome bd-type quinol oxidase subunit 1
MSHSAWLYGIAGETQGLPSPLGLSPWQFGITTVYRFILVLLTIGLAIPVAAMRTAWFVKKDPALLRMTKFFGKPFLICRVRRHRVCA